MLFGKFRMKLAAFLVTGIGGSFRFRVMRFRFFFVMLWSEMRAVFICETMNAFVPVVIFFAFLFAPSFC